MTTCRWCSQTGHNIRSCKVRKQWCADVLDDPHSTPGDRLSAQRYIERYDSSASKTRRCKFCKAAGHDLRTCSEFQEVIDSKADAIWASRRILKERFIAESFGPGSLITCEVRTPAGYVSHKRPVLATVIGIRWHLLTDIDLADSINWHHQRPMRVRPADENRDYYVRLPRSIVEVPFPDTSGRWMKQEDYETILNGVIIASPSQPPDIPSSFLNPTDVEKAARKWAKEYHF